MQINYYIQGDTMKYYQLEELNEMFNVLQSQPITSIKTSLELIKLQSFIKQHLDTKENLRIKLVEQFGNLNEEKGYFEIKPEDEKYFDFVAKYNELQDVEVADIPTLSLKIEDLDGLPLTLNQIKYIQEILTI